MTIRVYYGKGKSVLPAIMPYHILHAFVLQLKKYRQLNKKIMNNFSKTIRFTSSQVTIYMRAVDSLQEEGSSTFCIATNSAQCR